MPLSERIKLLRGKLSQESFGEKIGVSQSAVQLYEKGNIPKGDVLKRISEAFGVSVDWLLFGEKPPPHLEHKFSGDKGTAYLAGRSKEKEIEGGTFKITEYAPETVVGPDVPVPTHLLGGPDPEDYTLIAVVEAELASETGGVVLSEKPRERYAFRKDWLYRVSTNPSNLILMHIQGDSMLPTLQASDTAMVDMGRKRIRSGYLYAYTYGDSLIHIKRLEPRGDLILVISDNKEMYPPHESDRRKIHVIGQVIWYARDLIRE